MNEEKFDEQAVLTAIIACVDNVKSVTEKPRTDGAERQKIFAPVF